MYICIVRSLTENIYPFRPPPPSVTQICVADPLRCMWKILVLERMPLSRDPRLAFALPFTSSVCFYFIQYVGPSLLNGYIFSDKLYISNNVRVVLSNTRSGLLPDRYCLTPILLVSGSLCCRCTFLCNF